MPRGARMRGAPPSDTGVNHANRAGRNRFRHRPQVEGVRWGLPRGYRRERYVQGDERTPTSKEEPLSLYLLKLYVTGTSPRAELAVSNLRRICEQELRGEYELEIIDVLEHPQLAEDEKILATPTLIKQLPPPLRRVIGDLSDKEKVLLGLEVRPDIASVDPQSTQHDAP
jgi:circadian clock protein KaiB